MIFEVLKSSGFPLSLFVVSGTFCRLFYSNESSFTCDELKKLLVSGSSKPEFSAIRLQKTRNIENQTAAHQQKFIFVISYPMRLPVPFFMQNGDGWSERAHILSVPTHLLRSYLGGFLTFFSGRR